MCSTFYRPVIDMALTAGKIKSLRKSNGYSVKDLQAIFGFANGQAIYNWEKGSCIPTVDNLLILSALFKVSIEEIIVTRTVEISMERSA